MLLTSSQIAQANDREFTDVEVKEWGGTVRLCVMDGKRRAQYEDYCEQEAGGKLLDDAPSSAYVLLSMCIVDENLENFLEPVDLLKRSSKVCYKLLDEATRLNILTSEATEEEAKK